MEDKWVTVSQAADVLKMHSGQVREMVRQGKFGEWKQDEHGHKQVLLSGVLLFIENKDRPVPSPEGYVSVIKASEMLGVSRMRVYQLIDEGRLGVTVRVGRS